MEAKEKEQEKQHKLNINWIEIQAEDWKLKYKLKKQFIWRGWILTSWESKLTKKKKKKGKWSSWNKNG